MKLNICSITQLPTFPQYLALATKKKKKKNREKIKKEIHSTNQTNVDQIISFFSFFSLIPQSKSRNRYDLLLFLYGKGTRKVVIKIYCH